MTKRVRLFNGKKYTIFAHSGTNAKAQALATKQRKKGTKAKVLYSKRINAYYIYVEGGMERWYPIKYI